MCSSNKHQSEIAVFTERMNELVNNKADETNELIMLLNAMWN